MTTKEISDSDLGACANCDHYLPFRPHEVMADGSVMIRCNRKKKVRIKAKIDLKSPQECDLNK